eukprot:gene25077-30288_t
MGSSYLLGVIAYFFLTKFCVKSARFGAVPLTSFIGDFSYTSVTWTSTGVAYACGASGGGLLAKSSDFGVTWTRVGSSTVFGPLSDIASRSLSTTWWLAVDTNRYVYTSNITGTTWTRPARLGQSLNSVSIGSNGNAYVAGDSATLRRSTESVLFRTWTALLPGPLVDYLDVSTLDGVYVLVVGANGTVSYSSDSGNTWTAASSTETTDTIRCVEQISNTLAWAGGDSGYLAYTNNGGDTWTKVNLLDSNYVIWGHAISALSSTEVYVATSPMDQSVETGFIYYTLDGGTTWTQLLSTSSQLYSIAMYTSNIGVAGGGLSLYAYVPVVGTRLGGGVSAFTVNRGTTWTRTETLFRLTDVAVYTSGGGAVYYLASSLSGVVRLSSNLGQTWSTINVDFGYPLMGICIGNNGVAYAVGGFSKIYRSSASSSFATWNPVHDPNDPDALDFNDVFSLDGILVYVVGAGGLLYRSTNSGFSWDSISSGVTLDFFSIAYVQSSILIILGEVNTFLKSTDGSVWANQTVFTRTSFTTALSPHSISFLSKDVAYVGGNGGNIYRTVNGGKTFTLEATTSSIYSLFVYSSEVGVAGGSNAPSCLSTSTVSPSTAPTIVATFFSVVFPPRDTDGNSNGSSSEGNGTINESSVNASLAVGVLASLSSGAAEVVIVTEEEAILQDAGKLTLPSISLFPSGASSNGSSGSIGEQRESDEPFVKHSTPDNADTLQNNIHTSANHPKGVPKETELRPAVPSGVPSGTEYKSSQSPRPPCSLRNPPRYFDQSAAIPSFSKIKQDAVLRSSNASLEVGSATVVQYFFSPPHIRKHNDHNAVITRMAAMEVAVQKQRARIINSKLVCDPTALSSNQTLLTFDRAWCLDSSTGLFIAEPKPTIKRSPFRSMTMARSKVSPLLPRQSLPRTVAKAVSHRIINNRSIHLPHDGSGVLDKTELNAPDYLFVSYQLARLFPHLVESLLVLQYRSPLPGNTGLPWQRLVRRTHQQSVVTDQDALQYDASFGQGIDDLEKSMMKAADSSIVGKRQESSPMMPAPPQQGIYYSLNFFYSYFSFVREGADSMSSQSTVDSLLVRALFSDWESSEEDEKGRQSSSSDLDLCDYANAAGSQHTNWGDEASAESLPRSRWDRAVEPADG